MKRLPIKIGFQPHANLPRNGGRFALEPGQIHTIFGISVKIRTITPHSDWWYDIEVEALSSLSGIERWTIKVPTDYRTDDGFCVADL